MSLHVYDVDYAKATFPEGDPWELANVPGTLRAQAVTIAVSAAPPGRHDLSECEAYEAEWRRHAPAVLSLLRSEPRVCFLWAWGPMDWNGLPRVFPYMVRGDDSRNRYHIERITSTCLDGYLCSWVSFEFSEDSFAEMMRDEFLDLEYTRLWGLVFDEPWVERLIAKPFESVGLSWILEHDAIGLSFSRHFEGLNVTGRKRTVEAAIQRVRDTLMS